MCGRYSLSSPGEEIGEVFDLSERIELQPRFNIAPSQEAPVVREAGSGRRAVAICRWGLVPHWAETATSGPRSINARAETVAERPAFRDSFRRRRCLVPADGFYEWKRVGTRKQPFYFSLPSGAPFAMAGLWDRWNRGESPLESFAILTTEANREVGAVHHRMPVILSDDTWSVWLDGGVTTVEPLLGLLGTPRDGLLASRPVSTRVNSPANDDPGCVERAAVSFPDEEPIPPRLF